MIVVLNLESIIIFTIGTNNIRIYRYSCCSLSRKADINALVRGGAGLALNMCADPNLLLFVLMLLPLIVDFFDLTAFLLLRVSIADADADGPAKPCDFPVGFVNEKGFTWARSFCLLSSRTF